MYPVIKIGFVLVDTSIVKLKKILPKNNSYTMYKNGFVSLKFFLVSNQGFGPVCTFVKLSALYAIVASFEHEPFCHCIFS